MILWLQNTLCKLCTPSHPFDIIKMKIVLLPLCLPHFGTQVIINDAAIDTTALLLGPAVLKVLPRIEENNYLHLS